MTKPLVSIIVPIYNHARFIETALRSIVLQTYRPIELIVIDDGSQDGSGAVAQAFLRREMPGSILIQRENRGTHNTINQGMALASGSYIAILNSDDAFQPERIERCVDTARRTRRDFIFTGVSFINDRDEIADDDPNVEALRKTGKLSLRFPTLGFALVKNQLAVTTGNFFFSATLLKKLRGFRHYRYVHDWDFILRALFYTEPYFIQDELYRYRLHETNSFKSLRDIEGYETGEVMRNFLWLMTSRMPENAIAPCPYYWPGFFDWFIQTWDYEVYMMPRSVN